MEIDLVAFLTFLPPLFFNIEELQRSDRVQCSLTPCHYRKVYNSLRQNSSTLVPANTAKTSLTPFVRQKRKLPFGSKTWAVIRHAHTSYRASIFLSSFALNFRQLFVVEEQWRCTFRPRTRIAASSIATILPQNK